MLHQFCKNAMHFYIMDGNRPARSGGLNYETPFDKLQRVTKLLSQYTRPQFTKKQK
jgi:hypothetical protein